MASTHSQIIETSSRISHVSLALLYSSLPKLFLLSLLVIWKPTISSRHYRTSISANYEFLVSALQLFDESSIDREWLLRNVLGGIASGFSLRGTLVKSGESTLTAISCSRWPPFDCNADCLSRVDCKSHCSCCVEQIHRPHLTREGMVNLFNALNCEISFISTVHILNNVCIQLKLRLLLCKGACLWNFQQLLVH